MTDDSPEKIPVCIQTFLWRTSSAYFNMRQTKQWESSSLQFERTLVQNIHYGLSTSITDALNETPRWLVLKTALPFVMHCCTQVIGQFDDSFNNFESKILYTMHWLLLDAASECGVQANHPLSSLQLFVYLFAPLLKRLKPRHFASLKLQHGLKIWDALWNYSQPSVPGMCSPVKRRKNPSQEDDNDLAVPDTYASQDSIYCGMSSDYARDFEIDRLDTLQATYFDVAVLQCLMNSHWAADGILWALCYMQKRLEEIIQCHVQTAQNTELNRSTSMPLPMIEVSADGATTQPYSEQQAMLSLPKDDDELFIPRISEGTLLQKTRTKTHPSSRKPTRKRKSKTSSANKERCETADRSEDPLTDIKENNEMLDRPTSALFADGCGSAIVNGISDRGMPNIRVDERKHSSLLKKASTVTPALKVTPPNALNLESSSPDTLPRSKSEPMAVNASSEFMDEVAGSVHYITADGSINHFVVLQAVSQIMLNSKEQDIANGVLQVVDKLLQLYAALEQGKSPLKSPPKCSLDDEQYLLTMETIIRCLVALGCSTCSPQSVTASNASRTQANTMLQSLQRMCNDRFCKFFKDFAERKALEDIIDFFHASMNYCTRENVRNFSNKHPFSSRQSGFATNFGHSISGEGHLGVEGIIVAQTLKMFVSRLTTTLSDPTKSDNVHQTETERLSYNARKFLNYALEMHGGTFRRVAFSGLLDSAQKLRDEARAAAASGSSTPVAGSRCPKMQDRKQLRRPRNPLRDSMSRRRALSDTEAGDDSETEVKGRLLPGASARASKSDVEDSYTDEDDIKPKISFQAVSQATLAIVKARRKVKGHIRMITAKQSPKDASTGILRRASDLFTNRNLPNEAKEKRLVDLYLIRSGMLRFSFLTSVCHPGSIPDPEFLAALLQLDAPVAARASMYLECAYFVNQCTQGNWPSWMQTNLSTPGAYKRTITQQRTAAALFYRWAEAVGLKLKSVIESQGKDAYCVLDDSKMIMDSQEEDFLDEASLNPTGESKVCPHALKIIASLLIYEVTVFLREVYQNAPVVDPQYLKSWNGKAQGRRTSSATAAPQRPASPSPDTSGFRRSILRDPTVSSARSQRISLVGGAETRSSGLFGSTSSVNSTGDSAHHRKASTGTNKPCKKLSTSGSASSNPGVLMRSARSIKLKSKEHSGVGRPTRSVTSGISPPTYSDGHSEEAAVFPASTEPASATEQESYAEIYDELHNKLNWLVPIIQLSSQSNFICEHSGSCHPYCVMRQNKSCLLLTKALEKIYEVDVGKMEETHLFVPAVAVSEVKRPSVTRFTKSSSQMLLNNVVEATIGRRRSFDKTIPFGAQIKEPKKVTQVPPVVLYLRKHANSLMSIPLSIIMKSAAVMKEEEMVGAAAVAWEFLLQRDKEIVATAASIVLMAAGQVAQGVQDMILNELHHANPENRIAAVKRFYVLWTYRYQVWSRLESGAQSWFKLMPPSIDYTLPSPPAGLPGQIVPDPPWMPLYKLKLEELAANQEGSKSLVTATNTRRKQQQEMVAMALVAEECKKREAREAFPLSSVAVNVQAAQEFTKVNQLESDETSDEAQEAVMAREVVTAHSVFPTCVCLVGLALFDLLEDSEACNGSTVGCTVESVIKACMVEDASLFFRYLFEKLTDPSKRSDMFKILRKLVVSIPNLPSNAAYILFNNLVGYVLFYHRTANITASICINQAMSVIWQLVPSVQGLNFKDMKTMLKKVQSEQTLMITAHLSSAKKIIVHGIDGALPPQQFVVHEDTQFKAILIESLEYFSITEELDHYQLADAKTSRLRCGHSYIRDFYAFRRNNTPQLKLVKLPPADAFTILQKQAMSTKFTELCKVELAKNVLRFTNNAHMENQVLFLHEEFSKQTAFPRKALETEFSYFVSGLGDEMQGIDISHKLSWVQFLSTLFKSMPGTFGWTNELKLFLNVINGCLTLNCADHGMLRMCMAIYLNLANHFRQVFSTEGFLLIMPTVIKVFNTHLNYPTVRSALIFLHGQFFKLHRRPYLLQFLGSYEPFISFAETKEDKQALSEQLFKLLHSLERQGEDSLGILHLVWGKEPIKTLDFCYDENEDYKVLDAINTIITVVAYQTESHRSTQMLVVLEAIMPWYMRSLLTQAQRNPFHDAVQAATDEVSLYFKLSQSIRALIIGSEALMKPMAAHRNLEAVTSLSGHKKDAEESVFSARIEEGRFDHEQELETRNRGKEFRKPRDALLSIVSEFFSTCLVRLEHEKKHIERLKITPSYYLDSKSHERLAEVAHSLLRAGTYDSETMSCRGLQRYMQEILPEGDWLQETMKPSINTITKRLERIFAKVHKKTLNRMQTDWDALATLLRGVCLTLETRPLLHHLPHIKSLVNACTNIVLEYGHGQEAGYPEKSNLLPNHIFCTMVAKLAALHAAVLGETGGIEQMAYGPVLSREKIEMILANFVVPLCLRIGGNEKENHVLPQTDIRFILCLILSSLIPHSKYVDMLKPMPREPTQFGGQPHHPVHYGHHQPSHLLQKLAFLGMKAMLVCCEGQLLNLLTPLVQALAEVGQRCSGAEMWHFFDFTVSVRTIVYPLIKPYLQGVLLTKIPDTEQEAALQYSIKVKMYSAPTHLNKTHLLASFADELGRLRVRLGQSLGSGEITRTHSISMNTGVRRRFSTWRKNSLLSRIHQSDNNAQGCDRSQSMANVTTAKADRNAPAASRTVTEDLNLASNDNIVTDEIASLAPKLSRSSTHKGSRRGSSVPLKRISARDGANLLLEKFGGINNPSLPCKNKKYYAASSADAGVSKQPTAEERLVPTGRKAHALQLVKQPNVIIEEETTLSCSNTDLAITQRAGSDLLTESTIISDRAKGRPEARNVTQSDSSNAAIAVNPAEIQIAIPPCDTDNPLPSPNLLSSPAPHGLHRHGGLYQHPHEHNGGQSRGSLSGHGVSASIDSALSSENITLNIAAALKQRGMSTEDISRCDGRRLRKTPVDPHPVGIDLLRCEPCASSMSSKTLASTGLASKVLRRKGPDTAVLVQNEQPLATRESANKVAGIGNKAGENTTLASRRNSCLTEDLPYMDRTSSSDDEAV